MTQFGARNPQLVQPGYGVGLVFIQEAGSHLKDERGSSLERGSHVPFGSHWPVRGPPALEDLAHQPLCGSHGHGCLSQDETVLRSV